jgi:glycosyltransferase involved in cell wall biosynthesis
VKILQCVESLDPAHGGPVAATLQLGSTMQYYHGTRADVLTLDAPDMIWPNSYPGMIHRLGPGKSLYGYAPRLSLWLQQHIPTYDLVIVHGIWRYHSVAVSHAAMAARVPYFVVPHGMLNPWLNSGFSLRQAKKWATWLFAERRTLANAKAVIYNSDEERRLSGRPYWPYQCREMIVPFGIADPPPTAGPVPPFTEQRRILFLGRLHHAKACDVLIRAFAQSRPADIQLVMAGPDSYGWRAQLERLTNELGIADRVTWTGAVEGERKWQLLRSSELLVLPSHCESMGYAVLEALACGVPVLISDKVNIYRELAADGCALVDADTVDGTARSLQRWLELPPNEKQAMAIAARRCFLKRYEIRQAVSDLYSLLETEICLA